MYSSIIQEGEQDEGGGTRDPCFETRQLSVLQNQHRVLTEDQHYAITLRRASQLLTLQNIWEVLAADRTFHLVVLERLQSK